MANRSRHVLDDGMTPTLDRPRRGSSRFRKTMWRPVEAGHRGAALARRLLWWEQPSAASGTPRDHRSGAFGLADVLATQRISGSTRAQTVPSMKPEETCLTLPMRGRKGERST